MPERVVTKITPPHPSALIKNTIYSLGTHYYTHGERFDPNSDRSVGQDEPVWWKHALLINGAESGEYYYGRPGTFTKSAAKYGRGVLLSTTDSISIRGVVARLVGPVVPIIEIGKVWEPLGEEVSELIVQDGFYLCIDDQPISKEIGQLPQNKMFTLVERIMQRSIGFDPWELSTGFLKLTNSTSELMGR